ncbi:DUF881 domain-containing protein [Heyndrickxia vini]|uniref:DUF881 domain-containing protein n=2 Tax=Heyndrickxia vini TaxID=1476025 RepID=A0ABX7E845_9BACI|nr:DUF881 domain-containing protein [Heyndrickxia vini]QQZ11535.1 DUF881 domain-containing protein [Heyndrickxia vini]
MTLISVIIGFMLAIQFQTVKEPKVRDTRDIWALRDDLIKEQDLQSKLLEEVRSNEERISKYKTKIKDSKEIALQETLEELKKEAGQTDIKGPGIVINISLLKEALLLGQPVADVSPILLKRLVNDLNMYGAEQISIDGERLINTTVIRDINGKTKINGHSIKNYPFQIKIITENMDNANKLYNRIQVSPVIDEFVVGNLKISISKPKKSLIIPAFEDSILINGMESVE